MPFFRITGARESGSGASDFTDTGTRFCWLTVNHESGKANLQWSCLTSESAAVGANCFRNRLEIFCTVTWFLRGKRQLYAIDDCCQKQWEPTGYKKSFG